MKKSSSQLPFDFAIFGAVPHDHLLRGRTGALVDNLRKRGVFIYYFEIPPASILQYFKDRISNRRGIMNFLFPKPRFKKNIVVFPQPPIFPAARYEKGWLRRYNQNRLSKRVSFNFSHLLKERNRPVVAFVVTPWWYKIMKDIDFALLCYDCIDDLRVFCKEKQLTYFSELQKQLVTKSDLIFISAQKLRADINELRQSAPIEYLPNGVDAEFFISKGNDAPLPLKLKNLPKPIIGFVGSLFYWIDTKLIEITAKAFPNCSIVLVGPIHGIKLPRLPNIYLTGPEPYNTIPAYTSHFDVCLIPFIADTVSEKVDPVKVYEYLSLGKPVVAINLSELEKMKHLIYLAKNEQDFIHSIHQALQENNPQLKSQRIRYAQENSWTIRTNRLLEVINSLFEKHSKSNFK